MFSDDPNELCAFRGPIPEEYREAIESGTWNNRTTIRSLENFIEFEPAGWLPYMTPKPLLMIIAEHDRCTFTEVQRAVYEAAPATGSSSNSECRGAATHLGSANR